MRKIRTGSISQSSVFLTALIIGFQSLVAIAGDRSNVVGLGMGRTFTATSRGVDAIGLNPANLAVPGDKTFTLSFLPLGAHLGTDFLDYNLFRKSFSGDITGSWRDGHSLTESDKQLILSRFTSGTGMLSADADVKLVAVAFHGLTNSFGLAMTERVAGKGIFAKDYARFLLYGNAPSETFDLNETEVHAWWLREYSLTYAHRFEEALGFNSLSLGLTAKLVNGFGYFDIEGVNSSFTTSSLGFVSGHVEFVSRRAGVDFLNSSQTSFTPFPSPSGRGWGADLGLNAKPTKAVSFGISLTDLGSVVWTRNARERRPNEDFTLDDALFQAQRDSLDKLLEGLDERAVSFRTALPTAVHAGVAIVLGQSDSTDSGSPILLGIDYHQGLNDMPGNSRKPRLSVGTELRMFSWLPLRTGLSVGGFEGTNWAIGFGLHLGPFGLDLASENILSLLDSGRASRISVGAATRFTF